jgi:hypothetical protein
MEEELEKNVALEDISRLLGNPKQGRPKTAI